MKRIHRHTLGILLCIVLQSQVLSAQTKLISSTFPSYTLENRSTETIYSVDKRHHASTLSEIKDTCVYTGNLNNIIICKGNSVELKANTSLPKLQWQLLQAKTSFEGNGIMIKPMINDTVVLRMADESIHCVQYDTMQINVKQCYTIRGWVYAGDKPVSVGDVRLYSHDRDFTAKILVDSVHLDNDGLFVFNYVGIGNYLLQGIPQAAFAITHIPTYYGEVSNWRSAVSIPLITDIYSLKIMLNTTDFNPVNNLSSSKLPLRLYPNPATDKLYINLLDKHKAVQLKVYATNGKLLATTQGTNSSPTYIDISRLAHGMYIAEIHLDQTVYRIKFVH